MPSVRRLRICLIAPGFEPTLYGFDYVVPLFGIGYGSSTGALPLLAALVPDGYDVELVDENIVKVDWNSLASFDIIALTGMIVQRDRMLTLLERMKSLDATIVVGGPYVTVAEEQFDGLCDVKFIGEAETTWPAFLAAFAANEPFERRYEQRERTDMSTVPVPRYDLMDLKRYWSIPVQFSRGCPFQCEFCDIITIFGRKPRVKRPEQFVAEIDRLHAAGVRTIFVVDDNFYGNKRAARELLDCLAVWQRERNFPILFTTEASVNIADDPEFMEAMVAANFRSVFIGLESPRAASLNETHKFQNTRGDSLLEKIERVRDAGLVIQAGFIVGFDNDDEGIFEEQFSFISESGIAQAHVSILTPVPTTPLFDRLKAEGRLDPGNRVVPFVPKGMSQATLRARHADLLRRVYEPEAYFARVFGGYEKSRPFRARRDALEARIRRRPLANLRALAGAAAVGVRLMSAMRRDGRLSRLAPAYLSQYAQHVRRMGARAIPLASYVVLCAMHWHYYKMVSSRERFDFGNAQAPAEPEFVSV